MAYRPNGPAALLAMQRHTPRAAVRQVPVACLCAAVSTTGITSTTRSFKATTSSLGLDPPLIYRKDCGPLSEVLDQLWAQGVEGILLRPDVLGEREEVLLSADWSRFCVVKEGRNISLACFTRGNAGW